MSRFQQLNQFLRKGAPGDKVMIGEVKVHMFKMQDHVFVDIYRTRTINCWHNVVSLLARMEQINVQDRQDNCG